jgi:segregation and condensation protein A
MQIQENQYFKAGEFEGPLDLLLFLIRRSEINVYDIPIAEITEQYLSFLEYAAGFNLENLTDFYLMAATLIHIKSQMLLPEEFEFDDDAEDPRKELVEKLIEYQKYKKISELITDKGQESEWVIERSSKQRFLPFIEDEEMWQQIDVWDLLQTFAALMTSISSERIIDLFEEVSINEKLTLLNEHIEKKGSFYFTDLIIRRNSIMEIICAFLAVLESVKRNVIVVMQNKMFGDIRIAGREVRSIKNET